ncbi:hypothetical protein B0A48_15330 [Cryoendolithus antarcticus]|uniref:Uncharacterized protein n=1 Tax=Cryoendolithus antarcticus TaxID=1507870 RepID=A0A1V8SHN9_9PEZI|nr:hypothetical protein B0A48_15330 [Cryoendolithus antarcticus]
MKFTTTIALPALMALSVSAAPAELIKRKTCTLTWHGSHSYGGGGPGQEPIDNLAFSLEVVGGGKHYSAVKDPNGPNNSFSYTVGTAGWGGLHEIKTGASYNGAGSSWYSCALVKQGVTWKGTVKKSVIHSGTVSVTDDDCFIDFPCAE